MPEISRKSLAILRVLNSADSPSGAGAIAEALKAYGIDLTERAVRYHLERLDALGYTEPLGRAGRRITEKGRQEVAHAHVTDKV
ncbi:MAG: winged-helix domain-containing protein, partial [Candidatus Zipacnadales bacterium]